MNLEPLIVPRRLLLAMGAFSLPLSAAIIGTDDFTYTDGPLAGNNGGTGWEWNYGAGDQTNPGGISSWLDNGGTAPEITANALVTIAGTVERQYGEDQGNGAIQGNGRFFYKIQMTRSATGGDSFISHSDFGTPKVRFGADASDDLATINILNAGGDDGTTKGAVSFTNGQTHTLVCVVDFDNDKVGLFVDPDGTDYWTNSGNNSADVVRTFTNGNWSSRVRIESAVSTSWDDLTVATLAADVGLQDFVDADGDGLPADWEIANSLADNDDGTFGETSPGAKDGPNGALGNPDADGLTNREEFDGLGIPGFNGGTDPQDDDSDDDTLNDGPEVLTYNTNPLKADSDGDELTDGAEINIHLTEPNIADTDGGGTNDGTEIALGTLPQTGNAGDDLATSGDLALIGIEMFDYPDGPVDGKAGGDGFDFDNQDTPDTFTGHTGIAADWDNLWGDPQVTCQGLRTQESGALRQFNGLGEGNSADTSETSGGVFATPAGTQSTAVFWVKVDIKRSSGAVWSGLSLYNYGSEKAFIGVTGGGAATDELSYEQPGGGGQQLSGLVLNDGETNTIVARIEPGADPSEGYVDIYLNPNLGGAEPDPNLDAAILATFPTTDITAIRLASGGSGPTDWDNVTISSTWAGLSSVPANTGGLRDSFAAGFGLVDGPSGNGDGDGFTNLQEQANSTSPILGDTDGDDVDDDIEVTGSSNSFPSPATDPCDPDSDNDGMNDGEEISGVLNTAFGNAATDPNVADTDVDTFNDLTEIQLGTDPNDDQSNPTASGIIVIDGSRDPLYGAAIVVQTINSSFGNNELDAAYTYVKDGKLYLMVTGNLEGNFNKLELFFDTGDQITTNVFTSAGNDNAGNMNGMTFDTAFSPEYHVILRRGFDGSTNVFDLDIANLATQTSNTYGNLFGGSQTGSGTTGTGTVNSNPIAVAYDDSNTAGIVQGDNSGSLADQVAAAAVTTGIEICIDLADLGSPGGSLKVMVLLNNSEHNFLSNQSLAGLPETFGNLAGPATVDFSSYAGDQFFPVTVPAALAPLGIKIVSFDGSTMVVDVTGAQAGKTYDITSSITLSGFSPTGVTFTSATATGISIPADSSTIPRQFFRAEEQAP